MTTITISTHDGRTASSSDPDVLRTALLSWFPQPDYTETIAIETLAANLRRDDIERAGLCAALLDLNFAYSKPAAEYSVPTDPDDSTICEACE